MHMWKELILTDALTYPKKFYKFTLYSVLPLFKNCVEKCYFVMNFSFWQAAKNLRPQNMYAFFGPIYSLSDPIINKSVSNKSAVRDLKIEHYAIFKWWTSNQISDKCCNLICQKNETLQTFVIKKPASKWRTDLWLVAFLGGGPIGFKGLTTARSTCSSSSSSASSKAWRSPTWRWSCQPLRRGSDWSPKRPLGFTAAMKSVRSFSYFSYPLWEGFKGGLCLWGCPSCYLPLAFSS